MSSDSIRATDNKPVVNPKKFILWLMIISIIMMFAAFTSAYIVRRAEGNWTEFILPQELVYTSVIIVISSIFMQWAYISAKKDNLGMLKIALFITFALGLLFLAGQWAAWENLVSQNIHFGGRGANPSGSFLYVLTGVHGFHLITGLIFILIVLLSGFQFKVHSKNMLWIELCTIYWHFLGALWLYLYIFVTIYK